MSLKIPLTVDRCSHPEHRTGRVRFVLGGRCRPGEAIVLRRWRDRSCEPDASAKGITFEGYRLPPGTYQIINACIAAGFDIAEPITADALRPHYDRARREHPLWKAPNVESTVELLQWLARGNHLKRVLGRARSVANPGLPDLFLWKRGINGAAFRGEFIEVKRRAGSTRTTC